MRPAFLFAERNTNASPDFIRCPRCGEKTLGVNSLGVDYQVYETDHIAPSDGILLHARTMKSDDPRISMFLWSPRLASEYSLSLNVINREIGTIENGHHEFRVVAAGNTDPRLTLEYIRQLRSDEWRWYTGTHGIATEQTDEREPE
jgi:hypothetical protein